MDDRQIDKFYQASNRKINAIKLDYKRSLYSEINWNNRLIGIKGPRGVGKTTLILQHIKESFEDRSKVLYVSLDNLWFASNSLGELVEYHYSHGGTHIFLDEIHRYKYEEWQGLMKNIYDDYPELRIVYTGSSMLQMEASGGDIRGTGNPVLQAGVACRGCAVSLAIVLHLLECRGEVHGRL